MAVRTYSRTAEQAVMLMGKQIELARKSRRMSEMELARRIGVSRSTVQRIEQGITGVEIGSFFEAAAILGIPLFDEDPSTLAPNIRRADAMIALLPKRTRRKKREVKDDF